MTVSLFEVNRLVFLLDLPERQTQHLFDLMSTQSCKIKRTKRRRRDDNVQKIIKKRR